LTLSASIYMIRLSLKQGIGPSPSHSQRLLPW